MRKGTQPYSILLGIICMLVLVNLNLIYTSTSPKLTWRFGSQGFGGLTYANLGTDPTRVYLNFFCERQIEFSM